MLNVFDYIAGSRIFKKFKVDELLFVEYKCLIEETKIGIWSHNNCLVYVLGGKKKWKTRDKEYLVEGGEAIFIKKGAYTAHQYFDDDYCALLIYIPDEFIKSVVGKYLHGKPAVKPGIQENPIMRIHIDESLHGYFYSLLSYFPKPVSPPEKLLYLKFEELIFNILSNPVHNEIAEYFMQVHSNSKISIREIMEANFTFNMSLTEYARLCGRSLSSFKTEFCSIFKVPPGKWLIQKRLEYGRFLLETTNKSITEIAFESGFKNYSHFIRTFKEVYSITPLKFKSSALTVQDIL
ncbi:MAG: AraC family transcriptional regulator [Ignavibacteriaceae bacterium]